MVVLPARKKYPCLSPHWDPVTYIRCFKAIVLGIRFFPKEDLLFEIFAPVLKYRRSSNLYQFSSFVLLISNLLYTFIRQTLTAFSPLLMELQWHVRSVDFDSSAWYVIIHYNYSTSVCFIFALNQWKDVNPQSQDTTLLWYTSVMTWCNWYIYITNCNDQVKYYYVGLQGEILNVTCLC